VAGRHTEIGEKTDKAQDLAVSKNQRAR